MIKSTRRQLFKAAAVPALGLGSAAAAAQTKAAQACPAEQPHLIADPYVRVAKSPNDWRSAPWIGSPSIVKTASGRLLACHDLFGKDEASMNTAYFLSSEDGGKSWTPLGSLVNMFWPSLFRCASGLYVFGTDARYHTGNNHAMIARSDDDGRTWSTPVRLTEGLGIHTGNVGVLVSRGRVTRAFEVVPSLSKIAVDTQTVEPVSFTEQDLEVRPHEVRVADSSRFITHTLVSMRSGDTVLFCRVANVGPSTVTLRPERWSGRPGARNAPANSPGPWTFPAGARLHIATSGTNRDFVMMVMDADEKADLLRPESWRKSKFVGNPAYAHAAALKEIFGFEFREPYADWLEGVLVRLEHPGATGRIIDILRVDNPRTINLSAHVAIDDSGATLDARFDRYAFDPGLGCTHCYVLYDAPSRLYWLTSNVARDSTRYRHDDEPDLGGVQERSNLGLYYSRNCVDWFMAGLVAYSTDWVHSFHYPHFIIDGDDLLVMSRSHVESPLTEKTSNSKTAGRHNSNAATFHRVRQFRSLANLEFIRYRTG